MERPCIGRRIGAQSMVVDPALCLTAQNVEDPRQPPSLEGPVPIDERELGMPLPDLIGLSVFRNAQNLVQTLLFKFLAGGPRFARVGGAPTQLEPFLQKRFRDFY